MNKNQYIKELKGEVREVIANAQAALHNKEITPEYYNDIVRRAMKDEMAIEYKEAFGDE